MAASHTSSDSSSAAAFWRWFAENHEQFRTFDTPDREELLNSFDARLSQFDPELSFEFSEPLEDGFHELIISADGVADNFPKVESLVAAAPAIPRWNIIAFRPPQGLDFIFENENVKLDPRSLWFVPLRAKSDRKAVALQIGIPGLDEGNSEQAESALWTIADIALGEKLSAEYIRHIVAVRLPEMPADQGFIPLDRLPDYIESVQREINGA